MRKRFEKWNCDRCGLKYDKKNLRKQKGLYVCSDCYDDIRENGSINMKLFGNRSSGNTTTAVTSPTTFSITAAGGITPSNSSSSAETRSVAIEVGKSITFSNNYYMKVVGDGGAIDITVDPQISATSNGDVLSVEGTSNTNTVRIDNGTGVELTTSFYILGNGDVITLVYDTNKLAWVEVSRGKL